MSIVLPYLKNSETGAGMVEMMVALFILAVGLLGVLAMQANGLKSNQRAQFSTEAHLLAAEMVDRMMAYNDIVDTTDDDDYDGLSTRATALDPGSPPCNISTGCPRETQIAFDTWAWGLELMERLPNGTGTVSYNDVNPGDSESGIYTIRVMWDNELTGATGTGCSGAEADMTCYQLQVKL